MINTAKKRGENNIERTKQFILDHLYREDLKEDDPLFFNLQFDENGELVLGEGSDENHFLLCLSSKYMLSMLSKKQGVCHTDATYKITTSGHFLNVLFQIGKSFAMIRGMLTLIQILSLSMQLLKETTLNSLNVQCLQL